MRIIRLVGAMYKENVSFVKHEWEFVGEKNTYYEINAGDKMGRLSNKRLKKEMLNVIEADPGNYLGHHIGYSVFCTTDQLEAVQQQMVTLMKERLVYFAKALEESKRAVENMSLEIKDMA